MKKFILNLVVTGTSYSDYSKVLIPAIELLKEHGAEKLYDYSIPDPETNQTIIDIILDGEQAQIVLAFSKIVLIMQNIGFHRIYLSDITDGTNYEKSKRKA